MRTIQNNHGNGGDSNDGGGISMEELKRDFEKRKSRSSSEQ